MKVLITGSAGFIGFHLSKSLAAKSLNVEGIDNFNAYYPVSLKRDRAKMLASDGVSIHEGDVFELSELGLGDNFDVIIHLAAQAGVRYSLENPRAYVDANLTGFGEVLELARRQKSLKHLIFASSSSVYGQNQKQPFSTQDAVDHPVSLYAATKRANELMAHTYAHLYGIPITGLRFFTVYGPWGRPDMAYFSFTKKILSGAPIPVFGEGKLQRDFTYVDDIVEAIVRLMDFPPTAGGDATRPDRSWAPFAIYNIGNNAPVVLMDFIKTIEEALGKKAVIDFQPMQAGDVPVTWADCSELYELIGFAPSTPLSEGIGRFVEWYQGYYGV